MSVTPVVGADRRWVRIGGTFGFSGLTGIRLIQFPQFLPNILDGPGRRFTIVP
jgi:hypothetical protein